MSRYKSFPCNGNPLSPLLHTQPSLHNTTKNRTGTEVQCHHPPEEMAAPAPDVSAAQARICTGALRAHGFASTHRLRTCRKMVNTSSTVPLATRRSLSMAEKMFSVSTPIFRLKVSARAACEGARGCAQNMGGHIDAATIALHGVLPMRGVYVSISHAREHKGVLLLCKLHDPEILSGLAPANHNETLRARSSAAPYPSPPVAAQTGTNCCRHALRRGALWAVPPRIACSSVHAYLWQSSCGPPHRKTRGTAVA